jgi:hypothetical protein
MLVLRTHAEPARKRSVKPKGTEEKACKALMERYESQGVPVKMDQHTAVGPRGRASAGTADLARGAP